MTMRYVVEQDSPDGGHSVYLECFGPSARRGRVLSEHRSLDDAIVSCAALAHSGMPDGCSWIWDRLHQDYVSRQRLRDAGAKFTTHYPG